MRSPAASPTSLYSVSSGHVRTDPSSTTRLDLMKTFNSVLSAYGTSIFEEMNLLARRFDALNLGQGAPDSDGPEDVVRLAAQALCDNSNQYPPLMGLPSLRQAVAVHDRRFYGLDISPDQVLVTAGATEGLAAAILALIEPGDEVVLFEPLYDSYLPMVRRAGGIPRLVRLSPPDWSLPRAQVEAAFSDKTKLVILNSPMNPAAKVFSQDELSFLAALIERFDAYALCDEVYEHLVFPPHAHTPLMGFPGMGDRCLRVGSAGKTLSLTGWKVGYLIAAPALLAPVTKAHQFLLFTVPPNLQTAVAYGLGKEDAFFDDLLAGMTEKRDRLAAGLEKIGFSLLPSQGSYFINVDIRPLGLDLDDIGFCHHMAEKAGVSAIPVSAFYGGGNARGGGGAPSHLVRFCFAKTDQRIDEGIARMAACYCG